MLLWAPFTAGDTRLKFQLTWCPELMGEVVNDLDHQYNVEAYGE